MSGRAVGTRPEMPEHEAGPPRRRPAPWWRGPAGAGGRDLLTLTAGVVLVLAVVPPLASEARRVEAFEALRFGLLAVVVPALVALGAPWRRLGLAAVGRPVTDAEGVAVLDRPGPVDRLAAGRRRHPEAVRAVGFLVVEVAALAAWRTPPAVDGLARHPWLVVPEALTLVGAGLGLWLELVASPPLVPRLTHPGRIALAAVTMWVIWVTAYLVGLAHGTVYPAYHHVAGHGLSVSADDAVTTLIMWFVSACAFVPVVFGSLVLWLRNDEDPDDALYRLVRRSPPSTDGDRPAP